MVKAGVERSIATYIVEEATGLVFPKSDKNADTKDLSNSLKFVRTLKSLD